LARSVCWKLKNRANLPKSGRLRKVGNGIFWDRPHWRLCFRTAVSSTLTGHVAKRFATSSARRLAQSEAFVMPSAVSIFLRLGPRQILMTRFFSQTFTAAVKAFQDALPPSVKTSCVAYPNSTKKCHRPATVARRTSRSVGNTAKADVARGSYNDGLSVRRLFSRRLSDAECHNAICDLTEVDMPSADSFVVADRRGDDQHKSCRPSLTLMDRMGTT